MSDFASLAQKIRIALRVDADVYVLNLESPTGEKVRAECTREQMELVLKWLEIQVELPYCLRQSSLEDLFEAFSIKNNE